MLKKNIEKTTNFINYNSPNSKIYTDRYKGHGHLRIKKDYSNNNTRENFNNKSYSDLDSSLNEKRNKSLKDIDIEMNKKTKYIIGRNIVTRFRKSPYVKD